MLFLNLGWTFLGLWSGLMSLLTSHTESTVGLFWGTVLLSLLGFGTRGLGLFLGIWLAGVPGICLLHNSSNARLAWTPLYSGFLLAVYNLGSPKPLTLPVAFSQLLVVTAPILTFSWLAAPASGTGLLLAALAATCSASSSSR